MEQPAANLRDTPRGAVERIFRAAHDVLRFVMNVRESFDLCLDVSRIATEIRNQAGGEVSHGAFQPIVDQASRISGWALVSGIAGHTELHGLATTRLLTGIEAGVNDLVVALLARQGRWTSLPAVHNLRFRLGDLYSLSGKAQMEFLLEELAKDLKAGKQTGVGRYEVMLQAVGLGGGVDDNVRRTVLELAETRHVLVHREGLADAKFIGLCPWVPLWNENLVRVSSDDVIRFVMATFAYVGELMTRLLDAGMFDGDTDIDWRARRDEAVEELGAYCARPRQRTTGSLGGDIVQGLETFKAREQRRGEMKRQLDKDVPRESKPES